jgi:hypothetical protein
MGADCKSAGRPAYEGSNPSLSTIFLLPINNENLGIRVFLFLFHKPQASSLLLKRKLGYFWLIGAGVIQW